jgi:hypothetical protein
LVRPARRAFFRPDRRLPTPTRAEAVKVGRRSAIAAHSGVSRPHLDSFEHGGMLDRIGAEGWQNLRWAGGGVSQSSDEVSCRMFLCARCRSQVLICRRCDRGQIYCTETCAQDARRDNQRQARRRYQATPRGRAMHAARNRCYRARSRCVTDQGPAIERKADSLLALRAHAEVGEQSVSRKFAAYRLCHRCERSASPFLRLSEYPGRNKTKSVHRRL